MPASRSLPAVLAVRLPTLTLRRPRPGWVSRWMSARLSRRRRPDIGWAILADARRTLAAAPSWRAPASIGSYRSVGSVLSAGSLLSVGSFLSVGSVGSILSVGSAGSILSIGSSGSILSIGAAGGFARVGSRRDDAPDDVGEPDLRLTTPAAVRSIRPS